MADGSDNDFYAILGQGIGRSNVSRAAAGRQGSNQRAIRESVSS